MVAGRETSELAKRLIADTCEKQAIVTGRLTIHADRGTSMTSRPVALLMADLGVTKTHSRPHVSDDNPFSESQFKTLKYRPEFPERFGSIEDARAFCQSFFPWYNHEHHHSGIALLTPEMLHYGTAGEVIRQRQQVLNGAYARNPERFVKACPKPLPAHCGLDQPARACTGDRRNSFCARFCKPPLRLSRGWACFERRNRVAAVAVGMWKRAFCAGFQAPRAGNNPEVRLLHAALDASFPQRTLEFSQPSVTCSF